MNIGTAFSWNSSTSIIHSSLRDKRWTASLNSIHNVKCNIHGSAMIMHGLAQQHSMLQFLLMFAQFLHCCSCVLLTMFWSQVARNKIIARLKKKKKKRVGGWEKELTLITTHKLEHWIENLKVEVTKQINTKLKMYIPLWLFNFSSAGNRLKDGFRVINFNLIPPVPHYLHNAADGCSRLGSE